MSPAIGSLTGSVPGGSRAGFTQAGVVLHVRNLGGFTRGLGQAGKSVQLFGKSLQLNQLSGAQRQLLAFQNAWIGASNAIVRAGVFAGVAAAAIGGVVGAAALKTASDVQQLTFALQGLVAIEIGKQNEAEGLVLDMSQAMEDAIPIADNLVVALRDVALETPIQYEQIFAALRLQLAYGATATATREFSAAIEKFGLDMKKAESPALAMAEAVSQVGAVLARDSATFERLNYNLAQAIQKGDLTAKNMRELRNAGLSLADVFESELNMTLEETRAALKAGEIGTEEMSAAFISFANKYFAPAAERMTRSLRGLVNNFKDLWAFAATDAMSPMLETITGHLQELFDKGEALLKAGHFKKLGEDIKGYVDNVIGAIASIDEYDRAIAAITIKTLAFSAALIAVSGQIVKLINLLPAIIGGLQTVYLLFLEIQSAGLVAGIAALANPVVAVIAVIGALVVAIYAVVTAYKAWQSAREKTADSILADSNDYENYIEKLEEAKLANYALSESLYEVARARAAADPRFQIEGLQEERKELQYTLDKYDDYYRAGLFLGEWYRKLAGLSLDYREGLREITSEMSDQQLFLATNVEEMTRLYVATGKSEKAALAHAKALAFEAKIEIKRRAVLEEAADATDDYANSWFEAAAAIEEWNFEAEGSIDTMLAQEQVIKQLQDAIKDVNDAYDDWGEAIGDTATELHDLSDDAADAYQDYADDIKDINADLAKDLAKIDEKYDDSMPDATTDKERTGSLIDVWDEWARRMRAIIEVGGPEENLEQEGGWIAEIQGMVAGTEFALREGEENVQGWMMRLEKAFYEHELPEEFYEKAKLTRAWQEHFAEIDRLRKEDERKEREAAAAEIAAAEAALAAENAIIEQARQDALLQGALQLADATGQLDDFAESVLGPMATLADTPEEAFENIKNGVIALDDEWQTFLQPFISGLINIGTTAEGTAQKTDGALDTLVEDATKAAETAIPDLEAELAILQASLGGFQEPEELAETMARIQEIQEQLRTFGLPLGEEFPGAGEAFRTQFEGAFAAITEGMKTLGLDTSTLMTEMEGEWGDFGKFVFDVLIGNSVTTDFADASKVITGVWNSLMAHLSGSLILTVGALDRIWADAIADLKGYLTELKTALNNVKEKLQEIKELSPIKVTIEIEVASSPGVSLSQGTRNVQGLVDVLDQIPPVVPVSIEIANTGRLVDRLRDIEVVVDPVEIEVPVDLRLEPSSGGGGGGGSGGRRRRQEEAKLVVKDWGDAIIAGIRSWYSANRRRTLTPLGLLIDFTEAATPLASLVDAFRESFEGKGYQHTPGYQARIDEINRTLFLGNLSIEERNKLLETRNELEAEYVRLQEEAADARGAVEQYEFLQRQVDLLTLIKEQGLNARQVLGDITLGLDASTAELMQATTRALQAIIAQMHDTLKIASPSKVFMDIGRFMMEGMGAGIMDTAVVPLQAATSAAIAPAVAAAGSGSTLNLTMNNSIYSDTDMVVFENRVLDVVRRGVRGY